MFNFGAKKCALYTRRYGRQIFKRQEKEERHRPTLKYPNFTNLEHVLIADLQTGCLEKFSSAVGLTHPD